MTHSAERWSIFCLSALCLLTWTEIVSAEIHPYSARYSIYRNGTLSGKAEVSFIQQGENWVIESEGSGTHGLARVLGARDSERAFGRTHEGQFLPDEYKRHTQIAGMDDHWKAIFNWDARSVSILTNGDELTLELSKQAIDPLSLKVEMRQRLANHNPDLTFWLVDEDEIDRQEFRLLREEMLETSLGCLDTLPVEKVRTNSKRYTRAWHARDLDHVAVRIEHGKTGGDHMEMRITELSLAGIAIVPRPGCTSLQSAVREVDSH